ncbi:MAG TPA: hemolysin family protein [Candidatus Binatia bacterium]|jgi:putative hemolysin
MSAEGNKSAASPSFTAVLSPVIGLWRRMLDRVRGWFGLPPLYGPPSTAQELKSLLKRGIEAGVFAPSEQDMVEAVFFLGKRSARSLMTPRTCIVWLNLGDPPEKVARKIAASGHSRFPVARGTLDDTVGIVESKELLAQTLRGRRPDISASLRQPLFVPRSVSALQVLELFKESGKHIALVVDEYGGIEGMLTHHDILEAIAGEIPFAERAADPKAVKRHDGSWLLDGMLPVDEFKELFNLENLPGERRDAYQTLGGFLYTQMGRVPAVAERFEWDGLRFEIVDMDGKRIDKVLVVVTETPGAPEPSE